jgi:hypothetical protein
MRVFGTSSFVISAKTTIPLNWLTEVPKLHLKVLELKRVRSTSGHFPEELLHPF